MNNVNCINNRIIKSKSKQIIRSISISSDNKLLAVGQMHGNKSEQTLSLIDIETEQCIDVIEKSKDLTNTVYNVLFDKIDKNILYYINQIGTEYIYNAYNIITKERKILYKTNNKNISLKLSMNNNGNLLLPGFTAKLITFKDNTIIKEIKLDLNDIIKNILETKKVSIILSPNGQNIAITNVEKGKILIYNLEENKISNILTGNFDYIESLYYDPKEQYLLAIKGNNQLIIWNLKLNKLFLEEDCEYINGVLSVGFNSQYDLFCVGMVSPYIIIFDKNSAKRYYKDDIQDGRVYDVCFTNDGKKLISAGEDGKIVIRELEYLS